MAYVIKELPMCKQYVQVDTPVKIDVWFKNFETQVQKLPANTYVWNTVEILKRSNSPNQPAMQLVIGYDDSSFTQDVQLSISSFDTNVTDFIQVNSGNVVHIDDSSIGQLLAPLGYTAQNTLKTSVDTLAKETTLQGIETTLQGVSKETTLQGVAKETTLQGVGQNITSIGQLLADIQSYYAKETTLQGVAKETTLQGVAKETTLQGVAKETTLQGVAKETTLSLIKGLIEDVKSLQVEYYQTCFPDKYFYFSDLTNGWYEGLINPFISGVNKPWYIIYEQTFFAGSDYIKVKNEFTATLNTVLNERVNPAFECDLFIENTSTVGKKRIVILPKKDLYLYNKSGTTISRLYDGSVRFMELEDNGNFIFEGSLKKVGKIFGTRSYS